MHRCLPVRLVCSFFYSLLKGKFCNAPWLVTRHVTLGEFGGPWGAKLAMWGARNWGKNRSNNRVLKWVQPKNLWHGQGLFNESAGEAIHADFDRFYQRYAVKDVNSEAYLTKLGMAVAAYNASHI